MESLPEAYQAPRILKYDQYVALMEESGLQQMVESLLSMPASKYSRDVTQQIILNLTSANGTRKPGQEQTMPLSASHVTALIVYVATKASALGSQNQNSSFTFFKYLLIGLNAGKRYSKR